MIKLKISIGVSLRHIHLTKEDYYLLFDEEIKEKNPINQPGQFSALETVTLENGDRKIDNVRLIGPFRPYTQVEISRTDAYFLKLNPPVRKSGDLNGAEEITISTKKGKIKRKACILADRHIHITPEERKKYNLNKDVYKVKVTGEKGGIFDNVFIRENPNSYFEMHIDSDDANSFNLKQNDEVEIID